MGVGWFGGIVKIHDFVLPEKDIIKSDYLIMKMISVWDVYPYRPPIELCYFNPGYNLHIDVYDVNDNNVNIFCNTYCYLENFQ